jgi:hypothetical protein
MLSVLMRFCVSMCVGEGDAVVEDEVLCVFVGVALPRKICGGGFAQKNRCKAFHVDDKQEDHVA